MNIYRFSESWHRDGLEPALCFFLRETQKQVTLTFPTWKNLILQNILRYVEHRNALGSFNNFHVRSVLDKPEKLYPEHKLQLSGDELRQLPQAIYDYLINNGLGTANK